MHIWFPKCPVFFVNGVQSNIPVTAYNEIRSIGIGPASGIDSNIVRSPLPGALISHTSPLSQPFPMKSYL